MVGDSSLVSSGQLRTFTPGQWSLGSIRPQRTATVLHIRASPHTHSAPGPPCWPPGSPAPAHRCGAHSASGTCCQGLAGRHPCTTWNHPGGPVSECPTKATFMAPSGHSGHLQTSLPCLEALPAHPRSGILSKFPSWKPVFNHVFPATGGPVSSRSRNPMRPTFQ